MLKGSQRWPGWAQQKRSSPLWLPSSLTNVKIWVDGDTGTQPSWTDLSGQNNHLLQAAPGKQAVIISNAINGHNAYRFDGVDDFYQALFAFGSTRFYHIVFKGIVQGSYAASWAVLDSTNAAQAVLYWSSATIGFGVGENGVVDSPGNVALGTYIYSSCLLNGAGCYVRVNGVQVGAGATGLTAPSGLTVGGSKNAGANNVNVEIALIVAAETVPTAGELAAIEAYSRARYGL